MEQQPKWSRVRLPHQRSKIFKNIKGFSYPIISTRLASRVGRRAFCFLLSNPIPIHVPIKDAHLNSRNGHKARRYIVDAVIIVSAANPPPPVSHHLLARAGPVHPLFHPFLFQSVDFVSNQPITARLFVPSGFLFSKDAENKDCPPQPGS